MKKVVINDKYGGFGLSDEAIVHYNKLRNQYKLEPVNVWSGRFIPRDDIHLIEVIEKLGSDANLYFSRLKIVEIPKDNYFYIFDYDGWETLVHSNSPIIEAE